MAVIRPRQYMVERCHDHWWQYGAYRLHSILGVRFWVCLKKTDSIEFAKTTINEDMRLPIYINEPSS